MFQSKKQWKNLIKFSFKRPRNVTQEFRNVLAWQTLKQVEEKNRKDKNLCAEKEKQ